MSKIILMVGPPGSGKSTLAKRFVDEGFTYVNQDSQGKQGHLDVFALALQSGDDIVVDRMNFSKQQRDRYLVPAKEKGYDTEIRVVHEPYRVCLSRCLERKNHETIQDEKSARSALGTFFSKYERVQNEEADNVFRIYSGGNKPLAIICDLDGTLCNVDHRLHHVRRPPGDKKNWKAFFDGLGDDRPNKWCVDILKSMHKDYTIVFCSGRPDNYRQQTYKWLEENDLTNLHHDVYLYMRPRNDQRQDNIVKEIILDFEILPRFTPFFMIDDRKQVVDMYRERGFTVLQCSEGDF